MDTAPREDRRMIGRRIQVAGVALFLLIAGIVVLIFDHTRFDALLYGVTDRQRYVYRNVRLQDAEHLALIRELVTAGRVCDSVAWRGTRGSTECAMIECPNEIDRCLDLFQSAGALYDDEMMTSTPRISDVSDTCVQEGHPDFAIFGKIRLKEDDVFVEGYCWKNGWLYLRIK